MERSAMMSPSHQKLADKAEDDACCWGSTHFRCSMCSPGKLEDAFGGFPITDLRPSAKMDSMGEKHRCTRFPCPVCHPGRSPREALSIASAKAVVTPEMLKTYAQDAVQQLLQHVHQQTGTIMFGDGGHVCRKFPCPYCGNGNGRSAALEVEAIAC